MRTILGPFHPDLENIFVEEILKYKQADFLRPLLVLTPSDLLRRRLKILLSRERHLSLLNVQLLSFYQLSLRLQEQRSGMPLELRSDLFLEEALRQIIRTRRPGAEPFAGIEERAGGCAALWQTLRDLRDTGDEIHRIEGIFSGTLAYLFNTWDGSQPFSTVVRAAKSMGYTEPDPRDDLSGMDVARKLIILGREMGLKLELSDVEVESLVPQALAGCTVDEFLERLAEFDGRVLDRLTSARRQGRVLRYVGSVDAAGRAQVGLTELPTAHPFANIALTDNIVRFQTARYDRNPLIVQGPGAGADVTAMGVFSDILKLLHYLPR